MILRQTKVADHVLDDNNGIVDQDADAEYKSEEGDAVQSEAVKIENCERQPKCNRDGHKNDARLAPTKEQSDQQGNGECSNEQMFEQFVGLDLSRISVVARRGDLEVGR